MGKRLISQARGKGGPRYRTPKHRFKGRIKYPKSETIFVIKDLIRCPSHNAPLAKVEYPEEKDAVVIAAEGIRVGEKMRYGPKSNIKAGNIRRLKNIPEGTKVFNIESHPGDNGKFCRSAGAFARVLNKTKKYVTVQFPSKKKKEFMGECRAIIGTAAGSGIVEKPILKAGKKYKMMKARNKLYPSVSGTSMNAVDHPFGGTKSSHKGRPTTVPKGAPAGRKVGKLKSRRTGKKKGRQS